MKRFEAIRLRSIKPEKLLENCRHKETTARIDNTINDVHNSSYHSQTHQQLFNLFLPEEQRLHVFLHQYTRASCWRQNPDFFQPSHFPVSAISSHRSCCRSSKKQSLID